MRHLASSVMVVVLAGCTSASTTSLTKALPTGAPDLGEIVALVGEFPIYAEQVRAVAHQNRRTLRQALGDIVETYLLAELAERSHFPAVAASDPDLSSALVQRLLEIELEPGLRPDAIPESTLRELYNRSLEAFRHGRLVEISVLAIYTGPRMQGESRQARTQAARDLAAYLKQHPLRTVEEFEAVAQANEWKSRGVVSAHFVQGLDRPLSNAVGSEVAKLHAPGETTGMIEDDAGFFIARYLRERPASNLTFEQVRPELSARFYERWRKQQFLEFSAKFAQVHHVVAHFDRLSEN